MAELQSALKTIRYLGAGRGLVVAMLMIYRQAKRQAELRLQESERSESEMEKSLMEKEKRITALSMELDEGMLVIYWLLRCLTTIFSPRRHC